MMARSTKVRTCQKADMIQSDCQRSLNWSVILKYICNNRSSASNKRPQSADHAGSAYHSVASAGDTKGCQQTKDRLRFFSSPTHSAALSPEEVVPTSAW